MPQESNYVLNTNINFSQCQFPTHFLENSQKSSIKVIKNTITWIFLSFNIQRFLDSSSKLPQILLWAWLAICVKPKSPFSSSLFLDLYQKSISPFLYFISLVIQQFNYSKLAWKSYLITWLRKLWAVTKQQKQQQASHQHIRWKH